MRKSLYSGALALIIMAVLPVTALAQPTVDGDLTDGDYTQLAASDTATIGSGFGGDQYLDALYFYEDATDIYIGLEGNTSFNNHILVVMNVTGVTGKAASPSTFVGGAGALTAGDFFNSTFDMTEFDFGLTANGGDDTGGTDASSFFIDSVDYTAATATAAFLGTHSYVENTGPTTSETFSWTTTFGTANIEVAYADNDVDAVIGGAGTQGIEYRIPKSILGITGGGQTIEFFAAFLSSGGFFSEDTIPSVTGQSGNIGAAPDFTSLAGTQVTSPAFVPVELSAFQLD